MFAVMGVTGQVGSQVAHNLLHANQSVRVVVRDDAKAEAWRALGCEVAVASIEDGASLADAFAGTQGVFLMIPPDYDPAPGFPKIQAIIDNVRSATRAAKPAKLVFLSTVGAQVERFSLLNNSHMVERALRTLDVPVGFLRAAWFMENARWDVQAAQSGVMPSFLQPLDHPIPMVATADIARAIATMLRETWTATRVVELEGPRRYSANDIADGFAAALDHAVRAEPVPRETWESLFRAQGMQYPEPRIAMIDGFNQGWIDFELEPQQRAYGSVPLEQVLRELVG
jgi:NAD(P)H dehydrogenase (quinone)